MIWCHKGSSSSMATLGNKRKTFQRAAVNWHHVFIQPQPALHMVAVLNLSVSRHNKRLQIDRSNCLYCSIKWLAIQEREREREREREVDYKEDLHESCKALKPVVFNTWLCLLVTKMATTWWPGFKPLQPLHLSCRWSRGSARLLQRVLALWGASKVQLGNMEMGPKWDWQSISTWFVFQVETSRSYPLLDNQSFWLIYHDIPTGRFGSLIILTRTHIGAGWKQWVAVDFSGKLFNCPAGFGLKLGMLDYPGSSQAWRDWISQDFQVGFKMFPVHLIVVNELFSYPGKTTPVRPPAAISCQVTWRLWW